MGAQGRLVEIGRVGRPHGVLGEVKAYLHWAGSETLDHVESVLILREGQPARALNLEGVRPSGKAVLLRFEGVRDRDAAEALKGAALAVPRDCLPPLEEGEYYLSDLVGLRVVAPTGEVGRVLEVRIHPSVDSLVIETPTGERLEQPIADPWVERVDLEGGVVHLSTTEGLI